MIKIIHFGKFYAPDKGGLEAVTETLARGAVGEGCDVTVLCFSTSNLGCADEHGVHLVRVAKTIMVSSQPLGWAYLYEAVRRGRQSDIVHMHAPNMLAALAVLLVGRKPRVVIHWHSDVIGKGWLGYIFQPLQKLLLRRANRVICTSQAYADASSLLMSCVSKISVVPIGASKPTVPKSEDARASTVDLLAGPLARHIRARRLVLSVGRLVSYKGFSVLIEAAKLLPSNVAVVIAGDGPLRELLQLQIDGANVADRVLLAGRVSEEDLQHLYAAASVFCLPSIERAEAFGVVLLEAMAYGLPIVATYISGSGVPWVNQDGVSGINVAPGDSKQLAGALQEILNDHALLERLAKGAQDRHNNLFTEQKFVASMLLIYRSLVC